MFKSEKQAPIKGLLSRADGGAGNVLEAAIRRHHVRRLRRLGWLEALTSAGSEDWWSSREPVRSGNLVKVLIDGAEALPEMERAIAGAEHNVHIAGWHSSPDFRLSAGPDALPLRDLLARKAERVPVRLLMWGGPPLPVFKPTRSDAQQCQEEFRRDSRVQCELDVRERTMHCHHEKLVIIDNRIAFVGGIDLTALAGDRLDDSLHPARTTLGWHDCAVLLQGPAVHDVASHFVQRWTATTGEQLPEPAIPEPVGDVDLQILRTVPDHTYDFLPKGAFSILDAYLRALRSAESLIYLENQFLWSPEVTEILIDKLWHPPSEDFRMLLVLPERPSSGSDTTRGQLGRLIAADNGADRLLATTVIGSVAGGPGVYVHAKVGVIDDRWLTIGSANLNEHSLFNDTEMNVLTCDEALARDTRLRLWAEHTGRPRSDLEGPTADVIDRIWTPMAKEQQQLSEAGSDPVHRIRRLEGLSRRVDRLQGPLRGLLVDG